MPEVICAGHAAYDIVFAMEDFPFENHKYLISETIESPGGPACNASRLLGLWGVSCAYAGRVGDDIYGERILQGLRSSGVDTRLVEVAEDSPSPLSIVIANKAGGTRTILTRKATTPPLVIGDAKLKAISESGIEGQSSAPEVLLFDGHEPEASLELIEAFPDALVVLDGGTLRPGTELISGKADYAIISEHFAAALLERERGKVCEELLDLEDLQETLKLFLALYGKKAAISLGERGCVFCGADTGKMGAIPALEGEVVDTTAAGDIFHGAFAFGIVKGRSFVDSLKLATAAAGLSVRREGGWTSIPSLAETLEALNDAGGKLASRSL